MSDPKQLSNNEAIEIFSRHLRDNINIYYPNFDPYSSKIIGVPLGGKFAHTFKFILSSGKLKHIVYAKICPVYQSLDPAKTEYNTLHLLYDKISDIDPDLGVSRPIDYLPEINGYMLESVGNNDLRKYILKNNSILSSNLQISELNNKINGSARWLSAFHKITMEKYSIDFDANKFIDSFIEEFDYRLLSDFKFSDKTITLLNKLIEDLEKLTGKISMPCAKSHWDYTPGHVYLDNDKINVIDILGLDNTSIYEDIGHYLAALTSINNFPFYPLFDRKRAYSELCRQFIEVYFSDVKDPKSDIYLLTNIYWLKYLIIYFIDQYNLVSNKIHPMAGKLFSDYRLVKIFEKPMQNLILEISNQLNKR